jgi:hypothetical protein
MAAAPDDDARRTLAELEAKLRELERELLRGHEPAPAPVPEPPRAAESAPPADFAVQPAAPEPPPEPAFAAEPTAHEPAEPEPPPEPAFAAEPTAHEPAEPEPPPAPDFAAEPAPELAAEHVPEPPAPDFAAEPAEPEPPLEPDFAAEPAEPELDFAAEPPPPPADTGDWVVPGVPAGAPPEPEPEPEPPIDFEALRDANDLLASLRATLEGLGVTAERVTTEARAVIDDHGRTLGRLDRAAEAAARAEQAAIEAGRLAATVVVEAGPFADAAAVTALRDTLAAQPGARDAYIRGVEDGRAVIEVHLAPPPA